VSLAWEPWTEPAEGGGLRATVGPARCSVWVVDPGGCAHRWYWRVEDPSRTPRVCGAWCSNRREAMDECEARMRAEEVES